jgi:hypothetical protein
MNSPACKRQKYTPLGKPVALQDTSYLPAERFSDTSVVISKPSALQIFSNT